MFAAGAVIGGLVQPIKFAAFAEETVQPRQFAASYSPAKWLKFAAIVLPVQLGQFAAIAALSDPFQRSHCHAGAAAHVRIHRRTGPAAQGCSIIVPVQLG